MRTRNLVALSAGGLGLTGLAVAGGAAVLGVRMLQRLREYDLSGKSVLITGGSRGLGLAMAREFASQGARVAICARDNDELERARKDLEARGAEIAAIPCDITDRAKVDEMARQVESRFGGLDVLVNNAGVMEVGPMEVMTVEDFEEAFRTHFWGPLFTTLAVLPGMKRRRSGRIVNISSIGGKISVPHLLPYSASKFALTGFSEGLRAELAKDGIVVTTVCPGLMRTGSPRNATFKGQHRAEYAWFSVSDAMPLLSISAARAARRIVRACKLGQAEVVLSAQAKVAVKVHGLFPGLTADILGLANRLLPGPGGIGEQRAKGKESFSAVSPSWLTALDEKAARQYNQTVPQT
jgi:NAD(P)-dependent dehydrogenase (short-subunit alcohol dehydrogenase family)